MTNSEAVLLVKFISTLSPEDLQRTCVDDLEVFRNVPGLIQKFYISEESTGAISGFYIFRDKNAREAFWNSELAKRIPVRYGGLPDSFRVELYEMAIVLNEVQYA